MNIDSINHWVWLSAGLFALALEMLVPGVYLLWLGLAAIAVGLLAWLLPIGWALQVILFAVLAVICVLAGRRFYASRGDEADSALNRRHQALIGRRGRLVEAIEQGEGVIDLDDTRWPALGADAPAGTLVEVEGVDGSRLRVRALS